MEQEQKSRLETAMAAWKAKGNERLAEAVVVALEDERASLKRRDAA